MLKLPKSLRKELKQPLGELHKSIDLIENPLREQLSQNKLIISIGDATSRNLVGMDIIPQVCVVDNKIEREPVQHNLNHTDNIRYVDNPAGVLTDELLDLLSKVMRTSTIDNKTIVVVNGEEDLSVLPCMLNAPEDTIILYGQPREGVVLVKINEEARNLADNYYKQLIKE